MADLNFLEKPNSGVLTDKPTANRPSNFGRTFFAAITVIFFVGSLIGTMGFFLYYRYQSGYLADITQQRAAAESDLRPELVNRLVSIDAFISRVRGLLSNHVFISNIFPFLEKNIHLQAKLGNAVLALDTKRLDVLVDVPNYLVLSEQIRTFEASPFVDKVSFGTPLVNGPYIRFQVSIILKPTLFGQRDTQKN